MSKKAIAAVSAALIVGATSSALAAVNPFSDVPADHWAYDAVSQLQQDGVVNGYGDGTFRGNQTMTRYEMAQIVAKAMAKKPSLSSDTSRADKAMIDKLAVEFQDELKNLGVRVDELEKRIDNVTWDGSVKYLYRSDDRPGDRQTGNQLVLQLNPTMAINDNWTAHATMEYSMDANAAHNATAGDDVPYNGSYFSVKEIFAETSFSDKGNLMIGHVPVESVADSGLVISDDVVGFQAAYGDKWQGILTAGRFNFDPGKHSNEAGMLIGDPATDSPVATYGSLELLTTTDKYTFGAAYHTFRSSKVGEYINLGDYTDSSLDIWSVGGAYNFTDKLSLAAAYAKNFKGSGVDASMKRAYSVQLSYGEADPSQPGSFGIYGAYRYLTRAAAPSPAFDGVMATGDQNQKGWEIGVSFTPFTNVVGSLAYFKGKEFTADAETDGKKYFGQLEFLF
ncbi:MAG: S-layer homology domain-containing protein [Anaerovibrio sp.]|uniref:S-layer homology domain-containing protein n=1 Tax=Anaerovibrio sp. TaxID=1872532 RepID=UPI0025CE58DE|nr:S-layer homology domain-containing protein [Anaerovibrio sp.]MCR5176530.1 S-layer homology domain-containing protein [Anaerovibrio sp.]